MCLGLVGRRDRKLTNSQTKVLLFGQSSAADDVFVISTLPQASSLFKTVITESGGERDTRLNAAAQALGATYAKSVGCRLTDARTEFTLPLETNTCLL